MTFAPLYEDLIQLFRRSVSTYADRPLFGTRRLGKWTWISYAEFGREVDRLRGGLAELGIGPGDRVACVADNRLEWAVGVYACLGLGAVWVPMYEAQHVAEWEYILRDSGASIVFGAESAIDELARVKDSLPALERIIALDASPGQADLGYSDVIDLGRKNPVPIVEIVPEQPAGFFYTSGTTGNPKGVILSHSNIALNISAVHEVFPIQPEDRSLSILPWAHSFGQTVELHGLMSMGASIGIAESVERLTANLAEVKPTLFFGVPRIFNRLYDAVHRAFAEAGGMKERMFLAALENESKRRELGTRSQVSGTAELRHAFFDRTIFRQIRAGFGGELRYAFCGAAALSREVAEFIDMVGIHVYEGYGLTETSPIVTMNFPGSRRLGSVGKPIPGVRVEIDRGVTGNPSSGEILVFGHNVMVGYHGLPEANDEIFVRRGKERGIRTGDLGFVDGAGFLHITGRIKEQYKLETGKYVVPSPLEEQLRLSPYISNVMLYGENRAYNVALIVPDFDVLLPWCREEGLSTNPGEALRSGRVKTLFEQEIERIGASFRHYERVQDFALLTDEFSTRNGQLTPTLKLRREAITEAYRPRIQALYA